MPSQSVFDLTERWQLSPMQRDQLESIVRSPGGDDALSAWRDIDQALVWIFGDRNLIWRWLHARHPAFYHQSPLRLILGSKFGRSLVRKALLDEAAEARDASAHAASLIK